MKQKKLWSIVLTLALVFSQMATPVFGEVAQQEHGGQMQCICSVPCTGDAINTDCLVCGVDAADLSLCQGGIEEDSEKENAEDNTQEDFDDNIPDENVSENNTLIEEEKQCQCVRVCTEEEGNPDCILCTGDFSLCQAALHETPELDETPELAELSLMEQLEYHEKAKGLQVRFKINLYAVGDTATPFLISKPAQLVELGEFVNAGDARFNAASYKMTADMDLSGHAFVPIGTYGDHRFNGIFDGGGHTISGLTINAPNAANQGLFGCTGGNSEIKNLHIQDCDITAGERTGGVVGFAWGKVTNCSVSGTVSGSDNYMGGIGGVVGRVNGSGSVENCHATGDVSGGSAVGGVVGFSDGGSVKNCYATGTASGSHEVGGVVGNSLDSVIENCYATGDVSGSGSYAGGVVAFSDGGSVENCYATGTVKGSSAVGGVVGSSSVSVENCYATGDVSGSDYVGGVVGNSGLGSVKNCYATGDVSGIDYVGGVVGINSGSVENCYATGDVSGSGSEVGGVVGLSGGSVENCYATGDVSGSGSEVGGVVGRVNGSGSVTNCVALGMKVTGTSNTNRVVGSGNAPVNSYAYAGMTVNGNMVNDGQPGNANGENLSALGGNLSKQFAEIFKNSEGWNFADDKLPTLPGAGGQQSNDLPLWLTSATSTDIIYIDDEAGLIQLATDVNDGDDMTGKIYILRKDIQLRPNWIPIGYYNSEADTVSFNGIFDGNGCTISGLKINNASANHQGLFGRTGGNSEIKNLHIQDCDITAGQRTGGVVGFAKGKVTNCSVSGTVSGSDYVGGVVGTGWKNIENCNASVDVTGSGSQIGGVVGSSGGNVKNCYATGDVSDGSNVGGVVGRSAGSVENCYATGDVSGSGSSVGGVVGLSSDGSSVTNCVALGMKVTGTSKTNRVVGSGDAPVNSYAYAGMTVNGNMVNDGQLDNPNGGNLSAPDGKLSKQFEEIFEYSAGWNFADDKLPTLPGAGGQQSNDLPLWLTSATPIDFIYIDDEAGLRQLATDVNGGDNMTGKIYILRKDIQLKKDWTPIGYYNSEADTVSFNGIFDGNGCTISGLKINNASANYQGLFGRTEGNSEIKNLHIQDCDITAGQRTGGVVGHAEGKVTNCSVSGTVSGSDYVGGVVGIGRKNIENCNASVDVTGSGVQIGGVVGSSSSVKNCYATGDVSSSGRSVGGVVGYSDGGSVENCYATGDVSGSDYVGGVVGVVGYSSSGSVENCYATGDVSGSDYVGGVVGSSISSVTNCVALNSAITGTTNVNRVIGSVSSSGNISNCYALKLIEIDGANVSGSLNDANGEDIVGDDGTLKIFKTGEDLHWNTHVGFDAAVWEFPSQPTELPKLRGFSTGFPSLNLSDGLYSKVGDISADSIAPQKYTGSQITPEPVVKDEGYLLKKGLHYTLSYGENKNAGMNAGTVTIAFIGGLTSESPIPVQFDIIKGNAPTFASPAPTSMLAGEEATYTVDLSPFTMPSDAGTLSYSVASVADPDGLLKAAPQISGNKLTVVSKNNPETLIGKTAKATVTLSSTNYEDAQVEFAFELVKKKSEPSDNGGGGSKGGSEEIRKSVVLQTSTGTVSRYQADNAIEDEKKYRAEEIRIESQNNQVTLPENLIEGISGQLVIVTKNGNVTFPNSLLKEMGTGELQVTVEKNAVEFTVGGEELTNSGEIEVSVPYERNKNTKNVAVVITDADGNQRIMENVYDGAGKVTFLVNGSVGFEILDDYVKEETETPQEPENKENPFRDIGIHWAREFILKAYEKGIFSGVTPETFAPDMPITRGMIVAALYRMNGAEYPDEQTIFHDVAVGEYYNRAVAWAHDVGIVSGFEDGSFRPNVFITREQLAVMLYQYAKYSGLDVSVGENTHTLQFTDVSAISPYALPAMRWAYDRGILSGRTNGTIDPQGNTTRAEAASMIIRFVEDKARA